ILDHICAAENISYWLTAGTLIGALRHGGMIPWDCDIDVGMTEADSQAFSHIAHKLPADIFFQTQSTDPTFPATRQIKLRDRYSSYYQWALANPDARWHHGLQLDIIMYPQNNKGQLINPFRQTPYDRDEIFPLERIKFEDAMLLAPRNPDHYIRRRYGDYTQLPPPEERIAHEGLADPFTPCDHPESRAYIKAKFRGG
ncbi:MAG: hypothetical protein HKN05_05620, partial [Rhizobiales bacterium]|nr:hypothetical protein [Hyphomicrobiales bacterium]